MSFEWKRRAQESILHGALTNSKRPQSFVNGVYPSHVSYGNGCFLYDTDGKRYVDFICGMGAHLFGYNNLFINGAIERQLRKGTIFSLSSTKEVEAAERLKQVVPFVSKMRFTKTGTEACLAAVRIARAIHGVNYENEEMYHLLGNKELTRIPQGQIEKGWFSEQLQDLCKEIPPDRSIERNQEIITEKIRPDSKRQDVREKAFKKENGENKAAWQTQSISNGEIETYKKTVRNLSIDKFAGTSRGLQQATGRNMAMSETPFGTPPRCLVLTDGYHGHADGFIGVGEPRYGVIKDPYMLPLKGNEDLIPIAAAVIIEPIVTDFGIERIKYISNLRDVCTRNNTVLIFDEIITGFRWQSHTVSQYYGIYPDIICLGKALGGGLPLGVVGVNRTIELKANSIEWFVSGTFYGDCLALSAMEEIILMQNSTDPIKTLWETGHEFLMKFNNIWPDGIWLEGYPTRSVLRAKDDLTKALFMQEACNAGMLFGPSFFWSYKHHEHSQACINSVRDVMVRVKTGMVRLLGEMPQTPFAQKQRGDK